MGSDDLFKKRKRAKGQRKFETRSPKPDSFYIVTEGEKTEPQYFQAIANAITQKHGGTIDVKVVGVGRGTSALVEEVVNALSRSPRMYQHVWAVFDKDDFDDFDDAIALAERYGIRVGWSNQAFEYWLYLHFEYSDSALHRSAWVEKLDRLFKERGVRKEGYQKNLPNLYQVVTEAGGEAFAIGNAKRILEKKQGQKALPM